MGDIRRSFLLKVSDGAEPPVYRTVAGLRETAFSITSESIDITASGIFLGSQAESRIRGATLGGQMNDYELSFQDGERLRGSFLINCLNYCGNFNGERNYLIKMTGSGDYLP